MVPESVCSLLYTVHELRNNDFDHSTELRNELNGGVRT
jgi:hypothetical protein